jgi:sugar lactone lactonase YvrE
VWDEERKAICWIDILNGELHEFDTLNQQLSSLRLHDLVGTVALTTGGNFIAALKNGISLVDRNTGIIEKLVHPEEGIKTNRFNDGKCDARGRLWVGSMDMNEAEGKGSLYIVDTELFCSKKLTGLTISNGMAWSADNKTFYFIDTPTKKVVAYQFDIEKGEIENPKTVIDIPAEDGYPDGMTIDTEGCLWIAHWDGWQVARWNPNTGEKMFSIKLPVSKVTSCTFGGNEFSDLYITTARKDMSAEELEEQPLAGSLFVYKNSGYHGTAPNRFQLKA